MPLSELKHDTALHCRPIFFDISGFARVSKIWRTTFKQDIVMFGCKFDMNY